MDRAIATNNPANRAENPGLLKDCLHLFAGGCAECAGDGVGECHSQHVRQRQREARDPALRFTPGPR